MKKTLLFVILFLNYACLTQTHNKGKDSIYLDLKQSINSLSYSAFVDSVDYVTLTTGDSCLISVSSRIYFDGDTMVVKGKDREGIFVFTSKGELVSSINQIGQGPEEYVELRLFAIDRKNHTILIGDIVSQKILKFNYQGNYLGVIPFEKEDQYPHAFAITEEGNFLTFKSSNYSDREYSGVWLSDQNYRYIKHILDDVPKGYELEMGANNYHLSDKGIYYYNMNKDIIYLIQNDSAKILYEIDLKQKFPEEIRRKGELIPHEAEGKANILGFGVTEDFILLNYFVYFDEVNPIKWVLLDRRTNTIQSYDKLIDDIDNHSDFENYIFSVDTNTLCRVLTTSENDCNITLQLLYLK